MIQFPSGFDVAGFVAEIFAFATPFVAVFFIIFVYFYVKNILERSI
ncbi:MAG: hypothetical protein DDT19_01577 [Syntrophomonadaceae bacterium]|nr:hypothetical protein [Bacillota bacterium]